MKKYFFKKNILKEEGEPDPPAGARSEGEPDPPAEARSEGDPDPPAEARSEGDPDPPAGAQKAEEKKQKVKGRKEPNTGDIPYGSKGSRVKALQDYISTDNDYLVLLQYGSNLFGRTESLPEWSDPKDGLFGPRTDDAIRVFLKLHTKLSKNPEDPITTEMEKAILGTAKQEGGSFNGAEQNAVGRFAKAMTAQREMAAESVSYKKDLLKPTKNRHKELEKLVFERLVKGCK